MCWCTAAAPVRCWARRYEPATEFLAQLLDPTKASNLDFAALVNLLLFLGFEQRIKGSHHIFTKSGVEEIINLQPTVGNTVKAYQAKQVRELILQYDLAAALRNKP